jgi:hypothetical protein
MKKIAVLLAFFSLITTLAAQGDLRFGFQLSPTFSWMSANTNQVNSSGTNLGLKMAMIGEFYFQENYAFTTGLGFAFNQGGTLQYEQGGCYWPNSDLTLPTQTIPTGESSTEDCVLLPDGVKLKYKVQYLEIPVGLKMRTREFGYMRYYLEPALTLGFKTQTTGSVKGRNIGNDVEKINIKREVNGLNLAWGVGAGVEYSLSENTSLVGGLAFQVGFADVTDDGARMFNPQTNFYDRRESSAGKVSNLTIRLAVMF